MNGVEEGVEFLPVNNTKKVEKRGPKRWVVLVAVLVGLLLLSVVACVLVWHFQLSCPPREEEGCGQMPLQSRGPPNHAHTHTAPRLSRPQEAPLWSLPGPGASLDISEGPGLGAPPGRLGITRPHGLSVSHTDSCSFALHARSGDPYPARARCQWTLFDVASCDDRGSDVVMVYDTLSPVEPRAVVQLCGTYPPSYNLTFLSSQNVLLVTLITNTERRHPGFEATFFQLPKLSSCGGYLRGPYGTFSSPYYPGHYPPNMNCTWDIEVPNNQHVKVLFKLFYLLEPNVPPGSCSKDYVEVNGEKYCGERPQFVVASKSNKITVRFHSDQSYTDTGFLAEYLSFDSSDPCPGKFMCNTGRCIQNELRCDGWADCTDYSDELNCQCNATYQFTCKNKFCKPLFWVCDSVNDCGDNSDELECSCPAQTFRCGNGKCLPQNQQCDGKDNCGDGSDEATCNLARTVACTTYTYRCHNGLCLSKSNPECDGKEDCSDGSDEKDCGEQSCCIQCEVGPCSVELHPAWRREGTAYQS
uniref:CUB domain-containing protein n=1 Tax=Ursus americanus TaxID=9643 RepID=A0A452RBL4_URSAM